MSRCCWLSVLLVISCSRSALEPMEEVHAQPMLALDPAFGDAGRVVITLPGTDEYARLGESSGSEIIVCGLVPDGGISTGLLARLLADGGFDDSFHGNGDGMVTDGEGIALISTQPFITDFHTARTWRDGGMMVAGTTGQGAGDTPIALVAEVNREGRLDDRFNGNGDGTLTAGEGMISWTRTSWAHVRTLWPEPDGSWWVIGSAINSGWLLMTARIRASGQLDPSYGVGGVVYAPNEPESEIGWGSRATALPDGKAMGRPTQKRV